MIRAAFAALLLASPAASAPGGPVLTRLLACDLPLDAATKLAATLNPLRSRDDSYPDVSDINLVYAPDGAQVLGVPVKGVVYSVYRSRMQREWAFAARLTISLADASSRLLAQYHRPRCDTDSAPSGYPVCQLHLRTDPGSGMDVDVQVGERLGNIQFECLYGDLPH